MESASSSPGTLPETLNCSRYASSTRRTAWLSFHDRVVPEIGRDDIREIIGQGYRIIYCLLPDEVEVLSIHHGARLLEDSKLPPEV
jgi:plasmid stabilization system protein ParE